MRLLGSTESSSHKPDLDDVKEPQRFYFVAMCGFAFALLLKPPFRRIASTPKTFSFKKDLSSKKKRKCSLPMTRFDI